MPVVRHLPHPNLKGEGEIQSRKRKDGNSSVLKDLASSTADTWLNRPLLRSGTLVLLSLAAPFLLFLAEAVGGADWHNYLWAANTALEGKNPYLEWAQAMATLPSDRWPGRCDLPPLQLLTYLGCLKLGGAAFLYALFALAHAATALLIDRIGIGTRRPGLCLIALFWAIFPQYTFWFLQQASNKNVMTLLAVVTLLCAAKADRYLLAGDEGRSGNWTWLALLAAVFLGNFGWLGFAAVPLILLSSGWSVGKMSLGGAAATLLTLALHLPYFPDWKVMYLFRFSRVTVQSFHTSPLRFIDSFLAYFGIQIPLQAPLLFLIVFLLAFFAYRHPGNSARSAALAMITMALVRTDADPPTALMSLIIALVVLQETRNYLYLAVAGSLVYSYLATVHAQYGSAGYAFNILVPLVLPVALLVREQVRFNRGAAGRAVACRELMPSGSES